MINKMCFYFLTNLFCLILLDFYCLFFYLEVEKIHLLD